MFSSAAPRENIEILGKQNELFPSGPVIKCLLFDFLPILLLTVVLTQVLHERGLP